MMKQYGLHSSLQAKKGKGDELAAILLQAAELMHQVAGCYLYLVSKDTNQADCIWVSELWDSKGTHDNSLKMENVRTLIGKAMPLLDGPPQKGSEFEVIGGLKR